MKWTKLEISGVKPPSPRSGCNMFTTSDGKIVIYGGYCKEKIKTKVTSGKKSSVGGSTKEVGKTLDDMFLLVPDKHDETLTKWRWHNVKQTGNRPNPRSGIASAAVPNSNKAFFFGGVNDEANNDSSDDEDEDDTKQGNFYSDLYVCSVENEKATWQKIELTGIKNEVVGEKKSRRVKNKTETNECNGDHEIDDEESDTEVLDEELQDEETTKRIENLDIDGEDKISKNTGESEGSSIRVVEDGAFTISSTIIHSNSEQPENKKMVVKSDLPSKGNIEIY